VRGAQLLGNTRPSVSGRGFFVLKRLRIAGLALSLIVVSVALSACGSSSSSKHGTVRAVTGTAPDFLDPSLGFSAQASELTWLSYLGLYTYAHKEGEAGTQVIPALATALPKISADGRTYTVTLRKGLAYSNGARVKASDFAFAIGRSIKLNWGGKSFFTGNIVGGGDFDKGKSKTISGIRSDDRTGRITIHLNKPYGAFANVLAFPSAGLLPAGTKMSNLSAHPPPGVGPYMITKVVPNHSYSLVRNPRWSKQKIDGIPQGTVDVNVRVVSNTQTEAEQVLNNSADVFDWADTIPPSLGARIESQAKDRFKRASIPSNDFFFLNVKTKPFDNPIARQAVNIATDRRALSRLDSGNIAEDCFFLPKGIVGHPSSPCPYGDPKAAPDVAKATQMIKDAGLAGAKVTVWGQTRSPRKEYVDYFTSVLNKIGFKATPKIISDAQYFPTVGNLKLNPQTGVANWSQDFPNPSDFYLLMDASSIQPQNNENFSQVDDPFIQKELAALNEVPASKLTTVAQRWQKLDEYVAKKAYAVVFGYEESPVFMSTRIDFSSAVFHPVYGNDWSTWKLK